MGWNRAGDTGATWVTVPPALILALTVLIEEEEEESVHDGDKDPTPEGDAAGWPGVGLDTWSCVEQGHGGGGGSPWVGSPAS